MSQVGVLDSMASSTDTVASGFNQGDTLVEVSNLQRCFADKQALAGVSLDIKKGEVFGIVGENGAGKTTLIKHLLGMYKAQQGSVRLFGKDPVAEPESVLVEMGYLSEEPDLPAWMTVEELLHFSASFYPRWDQQYAEQLIIDFRLDTSKKVQELSKGQRARVGLVIAQAYRPEILLLDEPSSGLDPIVRKDILSAIIKNVAEEGRSVIFSSHLLDEIERVCDRIVMIHQGQVILSGALEDILTSHHIINGKLSGPTETAITLEQLHKITNFGPEVALELAGELTAITQGLEQQGFEIVSHRYMTLDEIFSKRSIDPQFNEAAR